MAKPVIEKIGEQIKKKTRRTGREDDRANAGLSKALVEINKLMIEYEKEGERLRGIEKEGTPYVNLDRGLDYDAIKEFPKVSDIFGKPEQWRKWLQKAGKEEKSWLHTRQDLSRKVMREYQKRKKKCL